MVVVGRNRSSCTTLTLTLTLLLALALTLTLALTQPGVAAARGRGGVAPGSLRHEIRCITSDESSHAYEALRALPAAGRRVRGDGGCGQPGGARVQQAAAPARRRAAASGAFCQG
eukprot:scaffold19942_cov52-Phaeocystis_antarctica.AAC.2